MGSTFRITVKSRVPATAHFFASTEMELASTWCHYYFTVDHRLLIEVGVVAVGKEYLEEATPKS